MVALRLARPARRAPESGAAAVEFALVVPFLLMLLFAIISFGLMLTLRQSISQAAAEGARAAAVTLQTNKRVDAARGAVADAMSANGVTCSATGRLLRNGADVGLCVVSTPQPCASSVTPQLCITVTLTYNYADHPLVPTVPGLGIIMPDRLTYSAVARVS